jgi:hypothetical protein
MTCTHSSCPTIRLALPRGRGGVAVLGGGRFEQLVGSSADLSPMFTLASVESGHGFLAVELGNVSKIRAEQGAMPHGVGLRRDGKQAASSAPVPFFLLTHS